MSALKVIKIKKTVVFVEQDAIY